MVQSLTVKVGYDMAMSNGNCTPVTLDMDSLSATAFATVLEELLRFFGVGCFVLVVHAYLFKFGHIYTSYWA